MDMSILSQCVDELYECGIEVWTCFDPDPNVVRIRVQKGDVRFEDSFEYTGFDREYLLLRMITDLANKVKNATKDSQ